MGPHDALFAQLPARELVRLMQTCRYIHDLVHEICFNLTRLLSPFLGDHEQVVRFRQIQAETSALISGSVALQFLDRTTYPSSDLDIYVNRTCGDPVIHFILETGYIFQPREQQDLDVFEQLLTAQSLLPRTASYPLRGIADILDFQKDDKKIQLILSESAPMEVILSFHSTCVMNVITHATAYALYPRATFITKQALKVSGTHASQEEGRRKYADRGWQMLSASLVPASPEFDFDLLRWVGDCLTWTLPLAQVSPEPDLCPINSWWFDLSRMSSERLEHSALEYDYFVADPPSRAMRILNPSPWGRLPAGVFLDLQFLQALDRYRERR
ncbi:hypothetical protein FB45DRAFT_910829 [Roridomyces roridus]|uniref:F-box domain-containing protein n=1 Tax=Roridomyces roridus TaxID=1738132 RepID=A0AAD7BZZ1_9AGAR|nr:hypothetical protein FB45DRAFT_910829 [Roridomyces roridus]